METATPPATGLQAPTHNNNSSNGSDNGGVIGGHISKFCAPRGKKADNGRLVFDWQKLCANAAKT